MSEKITEHQRLQVIGLLTVAEKVRIEQDRLARTLAEVVGHPVDPDGYAGIVSDAVSMAGWQTDPVSQGDDLISQLLLTVEDFHAVQGASDAV